MHLLNELFGTSGLIPHGYCLQWNPSLVWTLVISDAVIAILYFSIPFAIWVFAKKRPGIPHRWLFLLFGLFIVACGITHFLDVLTIWWPNYWANAIAKAITAILSLGTALAIWRIMPAALLAPSVKQLVEAKNQVELANTNLERRVQERTEELRQSGERFRAYFERSMVGMATTSIEKGWLNVNDALCDSLGYSREELMRMTWLELTYPEDIAPDLFQYNRLLSGEINNYAMDKRFIHKNGSLIYTRLAASCVRKEDGNVDYIVALVEDISALKVTEQKLIESEHFSRSVIDASSADICVLNKDGYIVSVNQAWRDFYDENASATRVSNYSIGTNYFQICRAAVGKCSEEASSIADGVMSVIRGECEEFSQEYPCHSPTEPRWFNLRVTRFRDDSGHVVLAHENITQRKLAEDKLKLAATVFSHAGEGIMITDASGSIIEVNDTFCFITGYSRDEAIGQNPRMLQSGRQSPEFYAAMWKSLLEKSYWVGEVWNRRKSGEVYAELLTISAVRNATGEVQNYVALFTDITLMKVHQDQLEHIAHYDALTNLPNRALLADRISQAIVQSQRHHHSLAVAFLDLDGFKDVNDVHGHNVGDELLIMLSQRMKEALREEDTLARIGGDEFVAVLADLAKVADCEPVLERLLKAAADPVTVGEVVLKVTASIGVALYPQDNTDADQLLRHADQAMCVAKQAGKNRYQLFDTAQNDEVKAQRESISDIRSALDRREFVLHYQPKVNMHTGEVIGVEALIRWQHPVRGLVPPISFLPIIENHVISLDIGDWVIDTALNQISQWQSIGLNLPISVNISALQLQQDNFVTRLAVKLADHPEVAPHCLELEVLETSALNDVAQVSATMNACITLGVSFALDDFGTGYSSLTYLRRLPAQMIKIDQSFVHNMLVDPEDLAIVEGVVGLAKAFQRDVIAEGVETIAHGLALLQLGCDLAQGYGISRPMPASDIPTWINDWRPDKSWDI